MGKQKYPRQATSPLPFTAWTEVPVVFEIPVAARLLGLTPEAVRRKAMAGELPGLRLHGTWRFRKDKIMAYLGFLPWEVDHYGFGMPIDQARKKQEEDEAGQKIQAEIERGQAS